MLRVRSDRAAGDGSNDALHPKPTWQRGLRIIAAIVVIQAVFWGLFYAPIGPRNSPRNIDRIAFSSAELAELKAPTEAAADVATYSKINLPYTDCCDPAYLSLRMTFNLTDVPPEGLGLVAYQQVDNFIYRLNGSVIHKKGRMEFARQTFDGQRPYLLHVPAGLLKAGENQINIITVRHGFPYTDLVEPMMGEYQQVREATAMRFWQVIDYRMLGGALTFLLGLFALITVFRSQDKLFASWLLVLCWSWTAYCAYGLVLDIPLSGLGRMVAFFALTSLVSVSLICFLDSWTRRPLIKLQFALIACWLVFTAATVYALHKVPMPMGFDLMDKAWSWFALAAGCIAVARLVWHFATTAEDRYIEAGLLSICAVCLALDAVGAKFGLLAGGYFADSAAILILAFVIAFLQRNFHLFQSALTLNNMLETNLKRREAELAQAYIRERELIDQQARNEERRRLMRDMHDGVGGQLVGLLLEVRRGAIDKDRMAEGLQTAMDEIRLMIDSVDATASTLTTMLDVFESRVRPRVEGAGLMFDWNVELASEVDLAPPVVLQIFRIMQEGVTNAIKHSGANTIAVQVRTDVNADLTVRIADNGKGLPANLTSSAPQGGHGLGNMRTRATTIGGTIDWTNATQGTAIVLSIPLTVSESVAA